MGILIWSFLSQTLSAQVPSQIDQYLFNGLVLNPAYAGSREVLHASLMVRQQWTGFGDAPLLGTFALDGVNRNRRHGFGLLTSYYRGGPLQQQHLSGSYAYRLPTRWGKLAFGLRGGLSTLQLRSADVATTDPGDPQFQANTPLLLAPEFGTGIWFETRRFYLGASAPKILGIYSDRYETYANQTAQERFFTATGGVLLPLSEQFRLKPTTLIKFLPELPNQVDLNLFLIYRDLLWLGASWRNTGGWVFLAEFGLNAQLHLGYAYNLSPPDLRPWNRGSHSFTLSYDFNYELKAQRPQYYW